MYSLSDFLSPRRFWRNSWTHFPVTMVVGFCLTLVFIMPADLLPLDRIIARPDFYIERMLMLALNFSTLASCYRRRFYLPTWAVIIITMAAALGGCFVSTGVYHALMALTLAACVVISCWTKRFYLQFFYLLLWFVACFILTFVLACLVLFILCDSPFIVLIIWLISFGFAPILFLGGLPFGDETYS